MLYIVVDRCEYVAVASYFGFCGVLGASWGKWSFGRCSRSGGDFAMFLKIVKSWQHGQQRGQFLSIFENREKLVCECSGCQKKLIFKNGDFLSLKNHGGCNPWE